MAAVATLLTVSAGGNVLTRARLAAATLKSESGPLPFELVDSGSLGAAKVLAEHNTFIFDCDGVLWTGSDGLLPQVQQLLERLDSLHKRCIFVTNNAAKSRAEYARHFAELGLHIDASQVVCSSFAAARWLRAKRPELTHAFVIGEAGLIDELSQVGITAISAGNAIFDKAAFCSAQADPRVGAVIVGHDTRFTFQALALASLHLECNAGCLFVATNPDAFDLVDSKTAGPRRLPGNGCLVSALATACGRLPDAVCGKPAKELADYLVSAFDLDPTSTCMVGDRMDTDIALATRMGATGLLVLTGCTGADELLSVSPSSGSCPDLVASHLGALLPYNAVTATAAAEDEAVQQQPPQPAATTRGVANGAFSRADIIGHMPTALGAEDSTATAHAILDVLHASAARADAETYLSCFHERAAFLGTDPTERWLLCDFAPYVRARFNAGDHWTYAVVARNLELVNDVMAVFDEELTNDRLGPCRASGVLVHTHAGGWRLQQYCLNIAVPNQAALHVAKLLRDGRSAVR